MNAIRIALLSLICAVLGLVLAGAAAYGLGCTPPPVPQQTSATASLTAEVHTRPAVEPNEPGTCPPVEVHFSPHGGCLEAVVRVIGEARKSVLLSAYGFTSRPVVDALKEAKRRGVDVRLLLDRSDRGKGPALEMAEAGAVVLIDAKEPIAHEKALVIDGELVEFGSYNFTAQAEKNREICVVMHDRELARKLAEDWHAHEMHAEVQQ